MNLRVARFGVAVVAAALLAVSAGAGLDKAVQDKIDEQVKLAKEVAALPGVVDAVKAYNSGPSAEATAMTQDKWKGLSVLDPFVRGLTKNPTAELLKSKKSPVVTEMILSGANGTKVAFLSKPSNWSHAGKPKHDKPMANGVWQGEVEVDESTGTQQLQVSVAVLDGDKPIGSLIVGLNLAKLKE